MYDPLPRHIVVISDKMSEFDLTDMDVGNGDRVMIVTNQCDTSLDSLLVNVALNQDVSVLKACGNEFNLTDGYSVNSVFVTNVLGKYVVLPDKTLVFRETTISNKSLVQRRSNFHGLELKVMMLKEEPFIAFPDGFDEFVSQNDGTFEVTQFALQHVGVFNSILMIMMKQFNFSTKVFTRKDNVWGNLVGTDNVTGAEIWSGIIGDVFNGRADMIGGSLGMFSNRLSAIEFLTPISDQVQAVFIANNASQDAVSWVLMFQPWRWEVWLIVTLMAVIVAALLTFLETKKQVNNIILNYILCLLYYT